jgi:hypothetical protein
MGLVAGWSRAGGRRWGREQPEYVCRFEWCQGWLERAAVGEDLGHDSHAADALGAAVFGERADVGVEPGGGLDDLVQQSGGGQPQRRSGLRVP